MGTSHTSRIITHTHAQFITMTLTSKPVSNKTYFCNYKCGAYFQNINDLIAHLEIHPVKLIPLDKVLPAINPCIQPNSSIINHHATIYNPSTTVIPTNSIMNMKTYSRNTNNFVCNTAHFDQNPPSPNADMEIEIIEDDYSNFCTNNLLKLDQTHVGNQTYKINNYLNQPFPRILV